MPQYYGKLTPNYINQNTDGSLDTAIINGASIQRTGYLETYDGDGSRIKEFSDGQTFEADADVMHDLPFLELISTLSIMDDSGDHLDKRVLLIIPNSEAEEGDAVCFWYDSILSAGQRKHFTFNGAIKIAASISGINLPIITANNGISYGTNEDNTALIPIGDAATGFVFEVHNNSSADMIVTILKNSSQIEQAIIPASSSHSYGYHSNNFKICATSDIENTPAIEDATTSISVLGVEKADVSITISEDAYSYDLINTIYTLNVASNQTVDEGTTLSITDIAYFGVPVFETFDGTEPLNYTINWGDGTANSTGVPTVDSPHTRSFDGSHTYADNGVYTVTVTVSDVDFDRNISKTLLVTVNNVAPTLTVTSNKTATVGNLLSITDIGSFTDPGFANPLNLGEIVERFFYVINWGDGSELDTGSPTIDTVGSIGVSTAGSFNGSHIYNAAGTYTVTVYINDDDSGQDTGTFQVTVS